MTRSGAPASRVALGGAPFASAHDLTATENRLFTIDREVAFNADEEIRYRPAGRNRLRSVRSGRRSCGDRVSWLRAHGVGFRIPYAEAQGWRGRRARHRMRARGSRDRRASRAAKSFQPSHITARHRLRQGFNLALITRRSKRTAVPTLSIFSPQTVGALARSNVSHLFTSKKWQCDHDLYRAVAAILHCQRQGPPAGVKFDFAVCEEIFFGDHRSRPYHDR